MKKALFLIAFALFVHNNTANAQLLRVSLFNQEGLAMGDMTKKEINSSSAGFVDINSSSGLEINYYPKNKFGVGLRWTGNFLGRDAESYETELKEFLSISDDQYDLTQSVGFWSFGTDLGILYQVDISEKWQFEPYLYFGFKMMKSPMSSIVYGQNNTTYQYQSKPNYFIGYSYSPGVKLHWNALKNIGLYISLEYNGNSFLKDEERTLLYSYNTFEISDIEKNYNYGSLNFGLGVAVRFGKALNE